MAPGAGGSSSHPHRRRPLHASSRGAPRGARPARAPRRRGAGGGEVPGDKQSVRGAEGRRLEATVRQGACRAPSPLAGVDLGRKDPIAGAQRAARCEEPCAEGADAVVLCTSPLTSRLGTRRSSRGRRAPGRAASRGSRRGLPARPCARPRHFALARRLSLVQRRTPLPLRRPFRAGSTKAGSAGSARSTPSAHHSGSLTIPQPRRPRRRPSLRPPHPPGSDSAP